MLGKPRFDDAAAIARKAIERFRAGEIDAVYMSEQRIQKRGVAAAGDVAPAAGGAAGSTPKAWTTFSSSRPTRCWKAYLPRFVETEVYRSMLETAAAEHAARMMAMEAATSNAGDMIDTLTLYMNRVRQASITKEIIEVVSGAAAAEE